MGVRACACGAFECGACGCGVCVRACVVCVCAHVYGCVCVCVCIHVHAHLSARECSRKHVRACVCDACMARMWRLHDACMRGECACGTCVMCVCGACVVCVRACVFTCAHACLWVPMCVSARVCVSMLARACVCGACVVGVWCDCGACVVLEWCECLCGWVCVCSASSRIRFLPVQAKPTAARSSRRAVAHGRHIGRYFYLIILPLLIILLSLKSNFIIL